MDLFQTLQTGAGAWNPLLWLVALGVALVVALAIRSRGRKDSFVHNNIFQCQKGHHPYQK